MFLTEAEAVKKWCPLSRDSTHDLCVSLHCAMWRWRHEQRPQRYLTTLCADVSATVEPPRPEGVPESWEFSPFDPSEGDPACWVEPLAEAMKREEGYCGLAGVPICTVIT